MLLYSPMRGAPAIFAYGAWIHMSLGMRMISQPIIVMSGKASKSSVEM